MKLGVDRVDHQTEPPEPSEQRGQKRKLRTEGRVKKTSTLPPISFALPDTWEGRSYPLFSADAELVALEAMKLVQEYYIEKQWS